MLPLLGSTNTITAITNNNNNIIIIIIAAILDTYDYKSIKYAFTP